MVVAGGEGLSQYILSPSVVQIFFEVEFYAPSPAIALLTRSVSDS